MFFLCMCFVLIYCALSVVINNVFYLFFFKQKTAYEMRMSDWSSDVCSSDLFGMGGRYLYDYLFKPESWSRAIDEAIAQASVNLRSVAAPAGEMTVLLGPGWPGVLLHEAVGHGLEGDFNRKGTSAFSGRIGQRVAAPGVAVVDDGSIMDRRGSLSIDDEGTPTQENILIEDGILK